MNWTALYAILKNSINTTKAELEQEITEKIGLTNQFLDELPEVGESGVLYFIPKDDVDPSAEDQYFMYVWDPDEEEFVLLDPDVDLSPYAKSADLATVATSGLYSDLSGTPDLTPYITEAEADEKYMSGDVLDDETVSGNPVTFESLDGGYAKSCEVTFSPIQSGSGDPSPTNIRPISGRDRLRLNQCGKNLFDKTQTLETGNITDDGSIGTATGYVHSDYICVKSNTTYTTSGDVALGNTRNGIACYDKNKTFLIRLMPDSSGGWTFTTPNNTQYIRMNLGGSSRDLDTIQLEEGSTATDYVAYDGATHTATFPDTVYGGKWLPQEGKAIIEWVAVDLGDFDYVYDSAYQLFTKSPSTITDILPPDINTDIVSAISENYKAISSNVMFLAENNNCFGVSTGKVFRIKDTRYTDATQFKTALSGVHLCYELATPTEITLTAEQIELLKGQNVLWSDGDNIKLTAAQLELVKVKANPAGQATDTLEKIQINDDIYEMAEPYTELTLKLDAGLTSLTFTDQSITTDSIFEVYTSVYGVNPTDITISTGSAVLTFESQQNDVNVKIRVWEDKHPLQVSNS